MEEAMRRMRKAYFKRMPDVAVRKVRVSMAPPMRRGILN
jgi:hypothetical protein